MKKKDENRKVFFSNIEGWLSLILNLVLFVIKLWAGIVSASVALIADSWHTLSDSVTSIVVLMGTRIASKPPDKEHPFGHGRSEYIASIIIGVLLVVVAFSFVQDSIINLKTKETANFGTIAIVVTVISMVVKEAMAQFAIRVGKKVGSQPMIADGWHHRSDALSSLVILIGILLGGDIWWIDSVLGTAVGLLILVTAIEVLKKAISPLLGENITQEHRNKLNEIARKVWKQDIHLHHIHIHKYGEHVEITFHIKLPGEMILNDAHILTEQMVTKIRDNLNMCATIYVDPLEE